MNKGMLEYDITKNKETWKIVHVWVKLILGKINSLLKKRDKEFFLLRKD